jgi:hypothetical protein
MENYESSNQEKKLQRLKKTNVKNPKSKATNKRRKLNSVKFRKKRKNENYLDDKDDEDDEDDENEEEFKIDEDPGLIDEVEYLEKLKQKLQVTVLNPDFKLIIPSKDCGALERTAVHHVQRLLYSMKLSSEIRGHSAPEFESFQDLYRFFISQCIGNKLVTVTMSNGKKVEFGFLRGDFPMPIAFTNGLYCSASPERKDNSVGYKRSNVKLFPICFNGKIQLKSLKLVMEKALQARTHEEMLALITDILTSPKSSNEYATSFGGKIRLCMNSMTKSTCVRQSKKRKIPDSEFTFKSFMEKLAIQGFRCDVTFAPVSFIGGVDAYDTMLSVDRLNSAIDHYSPDTTRIVCCFMNSGAIGGKLNNEEAAELTSVPTAYVQFIMDEPKYEIMRDNLKTDIVNATAIVDELFSNKYDENGFVDFVPHYLAMVEHYGKVVGDKTARKYYDSEDEALAAAAKKKFASFVHGINFLPTSYRAQRKELRAKSFIIDEYFKAKHNASEYN